MALTYLGRATVKTDGSDPFSTLDGGGTFRKGGLDTTCSGSSDLGGTTNAG